MSDSLPQHIISSQPGGHHHHHHAADHADAADASVADTDADDGVHADHAADTGIADTDAHARKPGILYDGSH